MGSPQQAAILQAFFAQQGITDPAEIQRKVESIGQNTALLDQRKAEEDRKAALAAANRQLTPMGATNPMSEVTKGLLTPSLPSLAGAPVGAGPKPRVAAPPAIPQPPSVTKPQAAPAAVAPTAPQKTVIVRQPDGSFVNEVLGDRSPEELAAKYTADVSAYRDETKTKNAQLAAEGAAKIERSSALAPDDPRRFTGHWPGGVDGKTTLDTEYGVGDAQARSTQRGAFSYMGTNKIETDSKGNERAVPSFDPGGTYSEPDIARMPQGERDVIRRNQAEKAQVEMRDVEVSKAKALAQQDTDPVGFRQKQVEQYMAGARQQLGDPKSFLHTKYQMGMREFMAKLPPTLTPEARDQQLNDFAAFLQNKLITDQAEADAARYGQWIASQDPRVLSSAARNPFAGMFGGGGAGGTP